jgi:hypothetical protein
MAGTFQTTGSYSNLSRLELEQLRKADFYAGSKTLTVGDSALAPEGVVGKGDINAEPYFTAPSTQLDEVYPLTAPSEPGTLVGSQISIGATSEVLQWFGPDFITSGTAAFTAANQITDFSTNFVLAGVLVGDILIFRDAVNPAVVPPNNRFTTAVVSVVAANVLTFGSSNSPDGGPFINGILYGYTIFRPNALQLFAVPGSGPTGEEQTFLTVVPGSTLHVNPGPTLNQINADRIQNLVPSNLTGTTLRDRADAVYDAPAPAGNGLDLGYRVILYPDDGTGTAPDLTQPITTLNPIIDPAISITDQRMTFDYKAGVIRFSCAPKLGGDVKVAGGVSAVGRLNLYAVFFAWDLSLTKGSARSLWESRSDAHVARAAARVHYNGTASPGVDIAWLLTENADGRDFFVQTPETSTDYRNLTRMGFRVPGSIDNFRRYFVYDPNRGQWRFADRDTVVVGDLSRSVEMAVADKTQITVGDGTAPPKSPADLMPSGLTTRGIRESSVLLSNTIRTAFESGDYGIIHLKRGRHVTNSTLYVPPGVVLEGEGDSTVIDFLGIPSLALGATEPAIKFGPNTPWGVYDATFNLALSGEVSPTAFDITATHVEGMAVVWNTVRRVWAMFWADATTQSIWYNEINLDGTAVFANNLEIKQTPTPLFTSQSLLGRFHTPGHYPRVAFNELEDTYFVMWVQEQNIGGILGPDVWWTVIQTNLDTQEERSIPFVHSLTYVQPTQAADAGFYTDHPSVAISNNAGAALQYAMLHSRYLFDPVNEVPTVCQVQKWTADSAFVWGSDTETFATVGVVTSTDVAADGRGGFMFVWSRHAHPLIMGTVGKLTYVPGAPSQTYLTDASIADWDVVLGTPTDRCSKYLRLGRQIPSAYFWDDAYAGTSGADDYGHDFIAQSSGVPANLNVRTLRDGYVPSSTFAPGATNDIPTTLRLPTASLTGFGTGLTTLTDGTKNFIALGVQAGDFVQENGTWHRVIAVAATTLGLNVADGFIVGVPGDPFTYDVFFGAHSEYWAIAPQSFVEGRRWVLSGPSTQFIQIAGTSPGVSSIQINIADHEPDFVRISRGNNGFLVAYQSMRTTAQFAAVHTTNWAETDLVTETVTTFGIRLEKRLNDYLAPHREYLGTNYAILSDVGEILAPSPTTNVISADSGQFYPRALRDTEISLRSLGTRAPVIDRPNVYGLNSTSVRSGRSGHTFNVEVGSLNWFHRWNSSSEVPSLIPAIAWSGQDWTIVSPTKRHIHSYTGIYAVDGGGNVTFSDATFFFGTNIVNGTDGNFQRQTLAAGDQLYFPGFGATTILSIVDEHTVTLNSNPLGAALSSFTWNVEWLLDSFLGHVPYGIKNLGFRVSEDGRIIISSSYNTFAAELPESRGAVSLVGVPPRQQETMVRTAYVTSVWSQHNRLGVGVFGTAGGMNVPSQLSDDPFQMGGRYITDIGFKGVAPGEPIMPTRRNITEAPMVALAWGETLFGLVQRDTSDSLTAKNRLNFYRQSFGPYNNGIRNMKIVNKRANPQTLTTTAYEALRRLSLEWVFTRHGAPVTSSSRFDTDGFRNLFAYPTRTISGGTQLVDGGSARIKYVYTDSFGRDGIHVDGPMALSQSALLSTYAGFNLGPQVPFQSEYAAKWYGSASPKVVWDGTRYMVAWTEGGSAAPSASGAIPGLNMICLAVAPGDEDAGFQTSELGEPLDVTITHRIHAAAMTDLNGDPFNVAQTTVLDIAFSGRTYAVLWVAGLETQTSGQGPAPGTPSGSGTVLGVTIFDQLAPGSNNASLDFDERTFRGGILGNTLGTPTAWDKNLIEGPGPLYTSDAYFAFTPPDTLNVRNGDIVISSDPTNATHGAYQVRDVVTVGLAADHQLTLDRNLPTDTDTRYVIKRPLFPGGGKSYVLGSIAHGIMTDARSEPYKFPKIIWDGREFVTLWIGNAGSGYFASTYNVRDYTTLYTLNIPEQGLSSGVQIKQLRPSGGNGTLWERPNQFGALGFLHLNAASPSYVCLGIGEEIVTTGLFIYSDGAGTHQDTAVSPMLLNGVLPGDILVLDDGPLASPVGLSYVEAYIIKEVTAANTVKVYPLPGGGFAGARLGASWYNYRIFRRAPIPKVMPGDCITIDRAIYTSNNNPVSGGTEYTKGIGTYEILRVDYLRGLVYLSDLSFQATDYATISNTDMPYVVGSIQSGSSADNILGAKMVPNGPVTNGRGLGITHWGDATTSLSHPSRVYGFVYNEVDDEYAVLWQGTDSAGFTSLRLSVFKLSKLDITKTVVIHSPGLTEGPWAADLAWNGTEYLVTYSDFSSTNQEVYALTFSPNLIPDGRVMSTLDATNLGGLDEILNQSGSPFKYLYQGFVVPTPVTGVRPRITQLTAKWNPRLSRWVIATSIVWYWVNDTITETNPINMDSVRNAYPLPGTTVVSFTGKTIILSNVGDFNRYIQPGMRIAFAKIAGGLDINATAIITAANYVTQEITIHCTADVIDAAIPGGLLGLLANEIWIIPREDVFCMTVGTQTPTVVFQDADGSSLDNVTISGEGTIEEKYTQMARPIWQSGGMMVGNWDNERANAVDDDLASAHRSPGYNHRFLAPSAKINLPHITNVRINGRYRYGDPLLPDGSSNRSPTNRTRRG